MELKGNKGRGGYRLGGGQPPKIRQYSDATKRAVMRALNAEAKKAGKTVYEAFAGLLLSDGTPATTRATLFRILFDVLVVKESHQTVEKVENGPVIGLPPVMETPPEYRREDEDPIH